MKIDLNKFCSFGFGESMNTLSNSIGIQ